MTQQEFIAKYEGWFSYTRREELKKEMEADLESLFIALRQQLVSGELNCEHDWLVDMYDHFGFPASKFCDKCNTREAI